ncbi:MAG: nitrogenase component 1 [Bacillota bacterium]
MANASGVQTAVERPCHVCQPLGAIYLISGIKGATALVHGPQSCCGYMRFMLSRHFKELNSGKPFFHEVSCSRHKFVEDVYGLANKYNLRLIYLTNTCLHDSPAEMINNWLTEMKFRSQEFVKIASIDALQPSGSYVNGYDIASKAVLELLARPKGACNGKLNIIPGMLNPGDLHEVKRILAGMCVPFTMLYDGSETLGTRPEEHMAGPASNYTFPEELADAANSIATIALCRHAGGAGADYLYLKFGVPAHYGPLPIGLTFTDRFVDQIKGLTGAGIPPAYERERENLLDAMGKSKRYTAGKRFVITGDPDLISPLTHFACELGMEPVAVMSNTPSDLFVHEIETIAKKYAKAPVIISGSKLSEIERIIYQGGTDMILGPSYLTGIAKSAGVPLFRIGFPVYDRCSCDRWPILGYRGGLRLLDLIVKTARGVVETFAG